MIRGDTAMRRWQDAAAGRASRGRRGCSPSRDWAARWTDKRAYLPSASDALVAVREGACDPPSSTIAALGAADALSRMEEHAATLLREAPRRGRGVGRAEQGEAEGMGRECRPRKERAWQAMTGQWARDVAFDVYLDQEVPD